MTFNKMMYLDRTFPANAMQFMNTVPSYVVTARHITAHARSMMMSRYFYTDANRPLFWRT